MSACFQDSLQVNRMRSADLPKVAATECANYRFPWSENTFRDCLKAGYRCHVLRFNLELIGYGILQLAADEAHILNLCIDAPFQKRGYARRLLGLLLDISQQQGAHSVFLEVRPSNPRAIELYQLAGFNEIGLRKNYYSARGDREDAIVMAKSL